MKILILSDIHGNLNALTSVLNDAAVYPIEGLALLGDLIDYGMHSNEVVNIIKSCNYKVLCNIRGNHEQAVMEEKYDRFSSDRGRESAKYTRDNLSDETWEYLNNCMSKEGKAVFDIEGKKFLAVHGSLADEYWKSINAKTDMTAYAEYDYVLSGHSHIPHFIEEYYKTDDIVHRNQKKTIFINPGSTGQPRNLNNMAQYAILDTDSEEVSLKKVKYDIAGEQASFNDKVDVFYKERLESGV